MLKDIDNDVQKFMQDFEENKVAAVNDNLTSAMDDSVSQSSISKDSQIIAEI